MSDRGTRFLKQWISENVREVAFPRKRAEGEPLATRCIAAAAQQHISEHELIDTVGDLVGYMFKAVTHSAATAASRPRTAV